MKAFAVYEIALSNRTDIPREFLGRIEVNYALALAGGEGWVTMASLRVNCLRGKQIYIQKFSAVM